MMIILLLILASNPVSAYNSGNTTVITRKVPRKQALLDRKFVFIQEGAAFKTSSKFEAQSSKKNEPSSSNLVSLSQPIKNKTSVITASTIGHNLSTSSFEPRTSNKDIYDENNWNNYSQENTEELGVRAWITNLPE